MKLEALSPSELPEVADFFRRMPLAIPPENLRQFALPRRPFPGAEVGALALRDGGAIVGVVGWLDLPFLHRGERRTLRWPINLHLLREYRGRGLGQKLMEATGEGATFRCVIGGNPSSIPVLEKTGWTLVGHLQSYRFLAPCLNPARLVDRFTRTRRKPPARLSFRTAAGAVEARWESPPPEAPWLANAPDGVLHDVHYLEFAFLGPLRDYHLFYGVRLEGVLVGFFVLAVRETRRPRLLADIVDLDAVLGHERLVIEAALHATLSSADEAHLRVSASRFSSALATFPGVAPQRDLPVRISTGEPLSETWDWHLTYGDHDRYRVMPSSQPWR